MASEAESYSGGVSDRVVGGAMVDIYSVLYRRFGFAEQEIVGLDGPQGNTMGQRYI